MKILNSRFFAFALACSAIGLANCGGGNVSIPAGHPGTSPVPTATSTVSGGPTVAPTATATASPTSKPTATPSPTATPTATATPTPTASPTTAACGAPPPDPNTTQAPIVTSSQPQVINVPCYQDFTGVSIIPANTTVTGPTLADIAVTSDSGAFNIANDPNAGARLLSTSIGLTSAIVLGSPNIATTVTSPSMINVGHIYEAELYLVFFAGGTPFPVTSSFQTNLVPSGHTISFNVVDPEPGNGFPALPVQAFVIIYQNH